MVKRHDRLTAAISLGLVLAALLACKRKKEAEPEPAPTAAAPQAAEPALQAPATPVPPAAGPKLGDVKRYPDREVREDDASVKTLEEGVKVFNEADNTTPVVATLPKDLSVVRLARLEKEGFLLIDFPSGVGQFSPGWVESKFLEEKGTQASRAAVLSQGKTAAVQPAAKPTAASTSTAAGKPTATPAPTLSVPKQVGDLLKQAPDLTKLDAGIALPPLHTVPAAPKQ
jgi:hypothetical protein